jgi:hypothetical protein
MLIKAFERKHAIGGRRSGVVRRPVVVVLMPADPTPDHFFSQLLKWFSVGSKLGTVGHRFTSASAALLSAPGSAAMLLRLVLNLGFSAAFASFCFFSHSVFSWLKVKIVNRLRGRRRPKP